MILESFEDLESAEYENDVNVIIDVFFFTSTCTELLRQGASSVTPFESEIPNAELIGGERGKYDFFNLPGRLDHLEVEMTEVALTSNNGASATLRSIENGAETYLCSPQNARAIADHLSGRDSVTIICAGTDNEEGQQIAAPEDLVCRDLLVRYFEGDGDLTEDEVEGFNRRFERAAVETFNDHIRASLSPSIRRATRIGFGDIVIRADEQRIVSITR